MADIVLLVGRIVFIAFLVLLLLAITKTGVGLVKGQREGDKTWKLYIRKGPDSAKKGQVIPVLGPLTIGRSPNADIVLQDEAITAQHEHAFVDIDNGGNLVIQDCGSRNGTFVNDRQIQRPVYLQPGDTIQVGNTLIKVQHA